MPKIYTRRNTNRIPQHDYSLPGQYFITLCAENRQSLFGTSVNNQILLNDVGNMVNLWWQKIFEKYPNTLIDEYIIMPNHIHGIINIVGVDPCIDPIKNPSNRPLTNNQNQIIKNNIPTDENHTVTDK